MPGRTWACLECQSLQTADATTEAVKCRECGTACEQVSGDIPIPSADHDIEWEEFWEQFLSRRQHEHPAEETIADPKLDRLHGESMKLLSQGKKVDRRDTYLPQERASLLSMFRFQLSTLLLGMSVLAIALGIVSVLRMPTAAARRLEAIGEPTFYYPTDRASDWGLKRLLEVHTLKIHNDDCTDADLALIAQLPELNVLDIKSETITDAGLVELAKLPRLSELSVEGSQITDQGLAWVGKADLLTELAIVGPNIEGSFLKEAFLPRLLRLRLSGNGVGDEIGPSLAKLQTVRFLAIDNTNVTPAVLESLRDLPRLEGLNICRTRIAYVDAAAFAEKKDMELTGSRVGGGPVWPSPYWEELEELV